MEVLRRTSNNYGVVQRVGRLTRHLQQHAEDPPRVSVPPKPARRRPRTLLQRLSEEVVKEIVAAYHAGATTREVGERFGLAHSSINKLLRQHGIVARRRSPGADEIRQAVELYEAGLSTRVIAGHLGFGASTILRALVEAGVAVRARSSR